MKLKQGIIKKLTENLDQEYGCIYDSYKTRKKRMDEREPKCPFSGMFK